MAGGLEILLSKGKPSKDDKPMDEEMGEMDESPGEEVAEAGLEDEYFDDAMEAMKSGDKSAFREAMKSAIEACMGGYGKE